jgi:hypothetical protein
MMISFRLAFTRDFSIDSFDIDFNNIEGEQVLTRLFFPLVELGEGNCEVFFNLI